MFTKFLWVSYCCCITEFSIYHWSNGVENFFCIFRGRNIKKSERNNIHIIVNLFSSSCSSWLSLQNSDQLNFCNRIENSFTTCILLALRFSIFRILIYSTNIFYFYTKISHFPFFTSLLSIFLFLSTNFLKFIIKRSNKSTISWKISFFNLQTF